MKVLQRLRGWLFKLTPLRISFLIMFLFLVLFVMKERGRSSRSYQSIELIEAKAYDLRFQVMHQFFPPKASDQVVIAAIDERTVSEYGWPFPRAKWAEFISRMREYGAKAVAFDVVFDQPGEYVGLEFLHSTIDKINELGLDRYEDQGLIEPETGPKGKLSDRLSSLITFVKEKEREADQDRRFAEELKKTDGVVLGWFGFQSKMEIESLSDQDFSDNAESLRPSVILPVSGFVNYKIDYPKILRKLWRIRLLGLQTNIPLLADNAKYFGFFVSQPEEVDGTLRRAPMISIYTLDSDHPDAENTFFYPSLSLAALSAYYGKLPEVRLGPMGVYKISVGDRPVPVDETGRLLINWMGGWHTYKYISIYDIITGFENSNPSRSKINPEKDIKGKIVLVGSEAIGAHDMRTSPFGTAPGVEMHANVISNVINGDTLIKPEWFKMFDLFFILVVGVGFGLALPRVSAISGGVVALLVFVGYLATNIYFFAYQHYSFTIVFPLAEIFFIYTGVTIFRYATEEREKRFIRSTFEHYLSPAVIAELVKNPSKLGLGGERKNMTAFFSDIQSFSSFSEKMEPEALVHFLNIYLTEMCDIILKFDGTIDKFEGDAIIAFFGAPLDVPDHAVRACLCAAEIQRRMVELREAWKHEGWPEVHMRIGLNTGSMVVGNMGSRDRMDFTIMGDSVNLAARLESAGKQYRIYSMISQYTRQAAGDVIEVRELDAIKVKGKDEPVHVYELLGKKGEVDPRKLETARIFEAGLALYRQGKWEEAARQFKQALEQDPKDGPSLVFVDRCEEFGENPPGEEWDGVYTMTTK